MKAIGFKEERGLSQLNVGIIVMRKTLSVPHFLSVGVGRYWTQQIFLICNLNNNTDFLLMAAISHK